MCGQAFDLFDVSSLRRCGRVTAHTQGYGHVTANSIKLVGAHKFAIFSRAAIAGPGLVRV